MTTPNALEFIERLDGLSSRDAVWSAFMGFFRQFGFIYGGVANIPGPQQRIEETTLCLSWPMEWRDRYFARNYITDDPVNLHLTRTDQPFTWTEMLSLPDYTKRQRRIVDEASEFGLVTGLIVPLRSPSNSPALVTISGGALELSPRDRTELHVGAIYRHARIRALGGNNGRTLKAPHLSPRERDAFNGRRSARRTGR
ncbi:MAG: autoinducer binding domain-containing protein [Alphaproteobacteria bacterium]